MKKPDRRKENRKKAAGALAGLGLAVFFFILLFGFGKADPENPMENTTADASHMYLTSSTLAMDKEKLASVENANISSGGSENQAQQEEAQLLLQPRKKLHSRNRKIRNRTRKNRSRMCSNRKMSSRPRRIQPVHLQTQIPS